MGRRADDLDDYIVGRTRLCMASILYEPVFPVVGRAFADAEGRLRAIAATGGLASTHSPGTSALVTHSVGAAPS